MYKWSKETWGRKDEEGDTTTKTIEGGTGGAKEEGDHIIGALVVTTLALNKSVAMMDEDVIIEPAKVANTSTPATRVTSWTGTTRGGGGAGVTVATTVEAGASTTTGVGRTSCKLRGWPKPGVNPTACLRARRLKRALDFLWPNAPALSSRFLLAKTEEGALGVVTPHIS